MVLFFMGVFTYQGKTKEDKIVNGYLEVESEDVARSILYEHGLTVVSITEDSWFNQGRFVLYSRAINRKDIVIFSRQLSVMVSAHIPLVQALEIVARQSENLRLQKIIRRVYTRVAAGTSFSTALSEYNKVFDGFYVNMIKSGETSGRLDEILNYLADQLEKDFDTYRKIKGALLYPLTLVISMIIAGAVILVYVIPKLVAVFDTMGVDIPWTTSLLIAISAFVRNFWWIIIFVIILVVMVGRVYLKTETGRSMISILVLRLPIFGKLFRLIYMIQFTRSLYTLLRGGVPLYDSLLVVEGVVQDVRYKKMIGSVAQQVRDGKSLSDLLRHEPLVPDLVSKMLAVGEHTGKMDYMLEKLSQYYTKEIDSGTETLMTLIEPLVMILLGLAVALLVSAVFLPLYTIPSF